MTTIDIFNADQNFDEQALEIFRFQSQENKVYRDYLTHIGCNVVEVTKLEDIPFLPIEFFKKHKVVCENLPIERIFKSSGTGSARSTHYIVDTGIYKASFITNFEKTYGSLEEVCILGLLPNYQENKDSSLLYMMNELIESTAQNGSEYLDWQDAQLVQKLKKANQSGLTTILVGVSFALLDLAEKGDLDLSNIIILETGGMKGQRRELTRSELHNTLKKAFNKKAIHSEYGMCELFSQAYALEVGLFQNPVWMQVVSRPVLEPFGSMEIGKSGVLKFIDLANIYSCSFIETQDLGIVHEDGKFEVLGRLDYSQLRGCNLMHA